MLFPRITEVGVVRGDDHHPACLIVNTVDSRIPFVRDFPARAAIKGVSLAGYLQQFVDIEERVIDLVSCCDGLGSPWRGGQSAGRPVDSKLRANSYKSLIRQGEVLRLGGNKCLPPYLDLSMMATVF